MNFPSELMNNIGVYFPQKKVNKQRLTFYYISKYQKIKMMCL